MFNSIRAENLFSWQVLNYDIKTGISQITGFNYDDNTSEGSGKSSIPNILCWVLYGRIPKDAKIDEVVRNGCKGGWGLVELENGTCIYRGRGPNDLYIAPADREERIKGKDAKETQLLINKLVGLNFEAFCQTIYFAQNYPNKFISSNETDKAAILSEIQDLTVFDKARKKVQERIKVDETAKRGLESQVSDLEHKISSIESNANLVVEHIQKFEADKQRRVTDLKDRIQTLRKSGRELVESLKGCDTKLIKAETERVEAMMQDLVGKKVEYSSVIKSAKSVESHNAKLANMAVTAKNNLLRLKAKSAKLEAEQVPEASPVTKPGNCPSCGQPASEAMLKTHVDRHKAQQERLERQMKEAREELAEELKEAEEQYDSTHAALKEAEEAPSVADSVKMLTEIEKEMAELTIVKRNLQNELTEVNRKNFMKDGLKNEIILKEKDLELLENTNCNSELERLESFDVAIKGLQKQVKELKKTLNGLNLVLANLETLKTGFKEVKQYVFQSLLNELSVKSTKLASELFEVPISIKFTNEDEEGGVAKILTNVTLDGQERSLGLYSGGQYRRIQLAVDLALASIVGNRSQNPIKFRVLDEPMKDLSETSMEKVVKLLEKLEGSTVIIEHNSIAKSIIHNVFDIKYKDGISHAS